ncbi:hypothetical protein EKO27_g3383 [Xylaria grammica]|uniref:Uncharacterized protein n=1 Tax=Xylaria grammica TaxID=363999 RepID=A0A439DBD1_9PEZI|nr:hypothetical protein EKO27_g3383 [Xylaria grammica]
MTDKFRKIAEEAERNLNTYEAKIGANKTPRNDEAVRYGQDLSTNAGYDKRIPLEEDGDLDTRGRQARGEHFEGVGGKRRHEARSRTNADDTSAAYSGEVMAEGREAAQSNISSNQFVSHRGKYPGGEYDTPQEVPGEMSGEGYEAPASVTDASQESERYR